jgi:GNAT superfamily N-acetyltransferase
MELRTLAPKNYLDIIRTWERAGLPCKPRGRDSKDEIARQMNLDREMFLGAFIDEEMVGFIMGSYDSRKGWLNRLAVVPEHRGKGAGKALVAEMEKRLKSRGFRIIATLIEDGHDASMELFNNAGYIVYEGITYLTKREDDEV